MLGMTEDKLDAGRRLESPLTPEASDDDDLVCSGQAWDEGGNKEERKKIRHRFRKLMLETQQRSVELVTQEGADEGQLDLQMLLLQQNDIFTHVKHTREAALDSTLLASLSDLGRQKAQNLQTGFTAFIIDEFCDKLMYRICQHLVVAERTSLTKEQWKKLWKKFGTSVQRYFKRSPPITYMYGALNLGENIQREEKKKRERKDVDQNSQRKVPDQVVKDVKIEDTPKLESTSQEAERILGILQRQYVGNERNPLCFFEFVLNPTSYGQTIENIFIVSFLVKDGYVRIFKDRDKLPVIEPVENPGTSSEEQKHQCIIALSCREWKELVAKFCGDNKKPYIPPAYYSGATSEEETIAIENRP